MTHFKFHFISLFVCCTIVSCTVQTTDVRVTSAAGQKYEQVAPLTFSKGQVNADFTIHIDQPKQTIDGFGASITESSAFIMACLTPDQREQVMREFFSEDGANFSAVRTMIGASDFALDGNYSYDDIDGDVALEHFSLKNHQDGFPKSRYPQVQDENYDIFQMMQDVMRIKRGQSDATIRFFASPWTAPAWMKDNGLFYDHANRRGGALKKEYYQTFANYLEKYLEAYREAGIEFWAMTPENEPMGNDGSWESMDFPPAAEAEFIGSYMGPTLQKQFPNVKIFCFDQNTFEAGPYTKAVYDDNEASRHYTAGTALHWYGSTVSCFPEVLDSLHALYPDKFLFHSEGCIDNLGRDPWGGVTDPEGFKESGWFNNDAFWWNEEATDWAYSTPFWPEWHPKYSAVYRYAQYIIDGVNHWMTGYIDWNIALDSIGGPTHVGNNCGAQVMVDYANNTIYFTPYHYAFRHFSRSMRPGDTVLTVEQTEQESPIHLCAVAKQDGSYAINILNMGAAADVTIQLGQYHALVSLPAQAVETLIVKL